MAQEIKMSAAGLKAMQEELEYLKTVRRKELAEEIKEARSHGDLSENSEYDPGSGREPHHRAGADGQERCRHRRERAER
jgi:transcription elongation factor GreA